MLPGAPRGGAKRNAVYRSYYFLPQYFRRVVKVSAVPGSLGPPHSAPSTPNHAATALSKHGAGMQLVQVALSSGLLQR